VNRSGRIRLDEESAMAKKAKKKGKKKGSKKKARK
jgi:hypothetical protein